MLQKIEESSLTPWTAFLILFVVWAGIFLPGLGSSEIKGEEARRIMPAVTMMETGNWIVPQIAGENYYNKPPLINWLIALSFSATGSRSEFAARLPSVISVLLFLATLVLVGTPWLTLRARIFSAIIFMTNISLLEKGRLIEIDVSYTCLTGIAVLLWLNFYSQGSKWKLWIVPSLFLGLGMLLKGPVILLSFYFLVIFVLLKNRQKRTWVSAPHLLGVTLWLGMFLVWVFLARQQGSDSQMTSRWSAEMGQRIVPPDFTFSNWLENAFKSFRNFMPWLLLVPLLWAKRWTEKIESRFQPIFFASRSAVVVTFLLMTFLPGSQPRYSLPIFPLLSVLLAWVLSVTVLSERVERLYRNFILGIMLSFSVAIIVGLVKWPENSLKVLYGVLVLLIVIFAITQRRLLNGPVRLAVVTGVLFCAAIAAYVELGQPILKKREKLRPLGAIINASLPPGAALHICKSFWHPMFFYINAPMRFTDCESPSADTRFLLGKKQVLEELAARKDSGNRKIKILTEFEDYSKNPFTIIELE